MSENKAQNWIKIGTITKTRGTNGSFILERDDDAIEGLKKDAKVKIGYSLKFSDDYDIEKTEIINKRLCVKIRQANDKESASRYREMAVYALKEDILIKAEREILKSEIVGFELREFLDGEFLGIVKDEIETPAHPILVVDYKGKEILTPNVEPIVKKIDKENKIVYVEKIEGLYEL